MFFYFELICFSFLCSGCLFYFALAQRLAGRIRLKLPHRDGSKKNDDLTGLMDIFHYDKWWRLFERSRKLEVHFGWDHFDRRQYGLHNKHVIDLFKLFWPLAHVSLWRNGLSGGRNSPPLIICLKVTIKTKRNLRGWRRSLIDKIPTSTGWITFKMSVLLRCGPSHQIPSTVDAYWNSADTTTKILHRRWQLIFQTIHGCWVIFSAQSPHGHVETAPKSGIMHDKRMRVRSIDIDPCATLTSAIDWTHNKLEARLMNKKTKTKNTTIIKRLLENVYYLFDRMRWNILW